MGLCVFYKCALTFTADLSIWKPFMLAVYVWKGKVMLKGTENTNFIVLKEKQQVLHLPCKIYINTSIIPPYPHFNHCTKQMNNTQLTIWTNRTDNPFSLKLGRWNSILRSTIGIVEILSPYIFRPIQTQDSPHFPITWYITCTSGTTILVWNLGINWLLFQNQIFCSKRFESYG
jgi:hypothetical protein